MGESDLDWGRRHGHHRVGWFRPTPLGERLMPVLTGAGPALERVVRLMRGVALRHGDDGREGWPFDIRRTTEYADLVSTVDELESLRLQVRDPSGMVVDVEHVGIDDAEFRLTLLSAREKRRLERVEREMEAPSLPLPRWRMQVHFRGGSGTTAPAGVESL